MTYSLFRRILFAALILTSWLVPQPAARADQCNLSCASGHRVCSMQARTGAKACWQSCGSGPAARQCRVGCIRTLLGARTACRAARGDCGTSCPAPLAAADSCSATCSGNAQTCLADTLGAGKTCLQSCPADTALPGCWEQCAAGLRGSGASCLAILQGCLAACQGPVSGACFDTIALQCTAEACSPDQACSQPNEFCSPRCAAPRPGGTCFDSSTMQCTQQPCSPTQPCAQANQTCVPECPVPPPKGRCFDITSKQCTDQPCAPGASCGAPNLLCTLQCPPPPPPPTPGSQCSSVPCGGRCVIAPPCPADGPCPEIASLLGQCALDTAGTCRCVPPSPGPTRTPQPTPTPQCASVPCGGPCVISPCPPGALCPEMPSRRGQCTADSAGACQCVPVVPPTQPPLPTPTPQCDAVPCGGQCVIVPPCPPGEVCPNFVIKGECRDDAAGSCQCMPSAVPTQTPPPTCAADADCNDDDACTIDHCVNGMCEHACVCLTATGAPGCCPGPAALCARCGADASGACGGTCPAGATCESLSSAQAPCGCVSDVGGPCGGNILAPPPVCAPGLVCQQSLPDITGVCVKPTCIPFFTAGCSQTADCCQPCGPDTRAPCAICSQGTCVGTP